MTLTNSCRLIGYCASDPILTQTRYGKPMAKVAIYTKDFTKNQRTIVLTKAAQRKDCHHWCIFFGKNAERAKKLLMKGSQVHIDGTIRYMHKSHAGKNFYIAQIWVNEFMLSSKAMMTKELYNNIFPELVVPYQVSITLKKDKFDLNIVTKLSNLEQHLSEQEIERFTIEFVMCGTKSNEDKYLQIVCDSNNEYDCKFTINKFIKIFYISDIPFPKDLIKKDLLNTHLTISIIIGERKLFVCDYVFRDLLNINPTGENENET